MNINFYATLRQITGRKTVEFDLKEGATIRSLLSAIIKAYPDMERELLDDVGNLYQHVHILVSGRDVPYLENQLDTVILETDKIDVFPAVGGGSDVEERKRLIRGIPLWLLREYLVELGGIQVGDNTVKHDYWTASIEQIEDFQVGSLVVGQVVLTLDGAESILDEFCPLLEKKLLRGGG